MQITQLIDVCLGEINTCNHFKQHVNIWQLPVQIRDASTVQSTWFANRCTPIKKHWRYLPETCFVALWLDHLAMMQFETSHRWCSSGGCWWRCADLLNFNFMRMILLSRSFFSAWQLALPMYAYGCACAWLWLWSFINVTSLTQSWCCYKLWTATSLASRVWNVWIISYDVCSLK